LNIYDTTLRDGEQAPGIHLVPEKKVRIARALEDTGIDTVEAGFPANGESERKAIRLISRELESSHVSVLCRPIKADIDQSAELLDKAAHSAIHLWIATSPIHMIDKLKLSEEDLTNKVINAIRYAKGKFDVVRFTSEDATRSNLDFLSHLMREAARAGADVISLADTVGCAMPEQMALMVRHIRSTIKDRAAIGIHCHNDLGLAVANSIAGIRAGATQVDVTVTGIGERAGNASLEQLAVVLKFHSRHMKVLTNIDPSKLGHLCDTVIEEMGLKVQIWQPLLGANAFKHESGIHVHGVINNPMTYELIDPREIGISKGEFIIGKHTGKAAIRFFIEKMGFTLDDESLGRLTAQVKETTTYNGPFQSEHNLVEFAKLNGYMLVPKEETG